MPKVAQACLVHGQDFEAINKVRDRTLDGLIPSEMRPENLTEYITMSNRALRLADIGWDIVSELSTLSLFEGSRRVVVVTDLRELCESGGRGGRAVSRSAARGKAGAKAAEKGGARAGAKGGGKTDPIAAFCNFVRTGLAQTPNAIVFLNYEKDMDTTVSNQSSLYKAIQEAGWVQECKGENKTFALEDALRAKDVGKAIRLFRDLGKSASPNMVFNTLLRLTRLLLQAKVIAVKRRAGVGEEALKGLFPKDRTGFFSQHAFVQKKNMDASRLFSAMELTEALKELLEINRLVIPVSTDVYVRDLGLAVELWMVKWFSRKGS